MSDKAVEVISWDPKDHVDVPGFAHGLTRYGGHWFDVGISVVPRDVDPLEALDKVFAKLREIVVSEHPTISYFTVDLRVASDTRWRPARYRDRHHVSGAKSDITLLGSLAARAGRGGIG
jgi:hypothetical protein